MSGCIVSEVFSASRWVVSRLATVVGDANARPRLLFGSLSLLTSERPRPEAL
jgi:hypothetical protein